MISQLHLRCPSFIQNNATDHKSCPEFSDQYSAIIGLMITGDPFITERFKVSDKAFQESRVNTASLETWKDTGNIVSESDRTLLPPFFEVVCSIYAEYNPPNIGLFRLTMLHQDTDAGGYFN